MYTYKKRLKSTTRTQFSNRVKNDMRGSQT